MAGQDQLELKFRLHDGTDIGPNSYPPATTVATLKESILAQWPRESGNGPKTISDMKLINAGRILENNKTLAESRVPVGELLGGVITMHVVVKPIIKTVENLQKSRHLGHRERKTVLAAYSSVFLKGFHYLHVEC